MKGDDDKEKADKQQQQDDDDDEDEDEDGDEEGKGEHDAWLADYDKTVEEYSQKVISNTKI